jgi:hypothetical protein
MPLIKEAENLREQRAAEAVAKLLALLTNKGHA